MSAPETRTGVQILINLHLSLRQRDADQAALDLLRTHLKFHPFPRLPTELRLQIWNIVATYIPKVHEICIPNSQRSRFITPSPNKHPVNGMLLANQESSTLYKSTVRKLLHISTFNYEIDTLFISPWLDRYYNLHNNLKKLSASRTAGIQKLALYASEFHSRSRTGVSVYTAEEEAKFAWLEFFPALKTLVLVCTTRNTKRVMGDKGWNEEVVRHDGMAEFVDVNGIMGDDEVLDEDGERGGWWPVGLYSGGPGYMKDGRILFMGIGKARQLVEELREWREERGQEVLEVKVVFLRRGERLVDGIVDGILEKELDGR